MRSTQTFRYFSVAGARGSPSAVAVLGSFTAVLSSDARRRRDGPGALDPLGRAFGLERRRLQAGQLPRGLVVRGDERVRRARAERGDAVDARGDEHVRL